MESYRTPCVLPDQQKLGGPTPEELSDGPQLHSHHHDFDGTEVCARLLRKKYEKGEKISAQEMKHLALTRHKTQRSGTTRCGQCKLFLRSSLVKNRTLSKVRHASAQTISSRPYASLISGVITAPGSGYLGMELLAAFRARGRNFRPDVRQCKYLQP